MAMTRKVLALAALVLAAQTADAALINTSVRSLPMTSFKLREGPTRAHSLTLVVLAVYVVV